MNRTAEGNSPEPSPPLGRLMLGALLEVVGMVGAVVAIWLIYPPAAILVGSVVCGGVGVLASGRGS